MRIFVVEQDGGGGLVHYAYQLCGALSRAGAEVTLVTGQHYELEHLPHSFTVEPRIRLWNPVGSSLPDSRLASIMVRTFRRFRRGFRGIRYAYEWHRLTRYLLGERPDVVQFSTIRFPFQALALRRLRRAGITLTQICHEFESRDHGGMTRAVTLRRSPAAFNTFDRIYLHGDGNRSRFHSIFDLPDDRTRSIPHGDESLFLELAESLAEPADAIPTALFFGGLRPSKGLDVLIAAWKQVQHEVDAKLMICGEPEGVDPIALREQAELIGVAASVEIDARYQPAERVADLMTRATVVVLPYRSATASGVLQVAYAFGVPVVASAVGTLAEDVKHGETGLLVEPDDSPGLSRALVQLLSDPTEAARMGAEARRAGEGFGWDPIAESIVTDYEALAS